MAVGPNKLYAKAFKPTEVVAIYRGVTQTDLDDCAYPAAATDLPLGVTQELLNANHLADARAIQVMLMGTSFLETGAAVAINQPLALDVNGKGVPAAVGNAVVGTARLATTGDGQLTVVQLGYGVAPSV